MTDKKNTIHYGILFEEYADEIDIPDEFITDNDSFLDWGQTHIDSTFHVQSHTDLGIENYNELRSHIVYERFTLAGYLKSGQRLMDYAVITDREDFSENSHVWTPDNVIT